MACNGTFINIIRGIIVAILFVCHAKRWPQKHLGKITVDSSPKGGAILWTPKGSIDECTWANV
jgi:hypothetical protein